MLREMAADERPREKLKLRGSAALSDGELLAIILNTGLPGETVTDVSQRLLAHHGGLRGLFRLDVAELARVRGLGDAKAVRVKAALELGRRLAALSPEERPPVGSPEDVANLLGIEMAALEQEQLRVVLLDTKHRILGTRTVYQGSVNQHKFECRCGSNPPAPSSPPRNECLPDHPTSMYASMDGSGVKLMEPARTVPEAVASRKVSASSGSSRMRRLTPVQVRSSETVSTPGTSGSRTGKVARTVAESSSSLT